jgi:BirA family transcriptional regulator, biotin operon repressor / biotin---[acetyl-CoA-carboxylase] ligase
MRAENPTPGQPASSGRVPPDAEVATEAAAGRKPLDAAAGRKPLDAASLRRAVLRPGSLWYAVEVEDRTGSTNADLLARALAGAPEGLVLAAEEQSAGRGRLGRTWVSPPRAALTFSLLVRPAAVPLARRGWLSLLAGVAVASAVTAVTGVPTQLKWPNDVLAAPAPGASAAPAPGASAAPATGASTAPGASAGPSISAGPGAGTSAAKLAGILAEATGDAVIVGVGLNVSTEPGELPPSGPGALAATSLRIAGAAALAREPLLAAILAGFERWYLAWRQADGDPGRCGLRAEYTRWSGTIGRRVRVELPGGQVLSGLAVGVEEDGRLLVRVSPDAELSVAAGDVVHLR